MSMFGALAVAFVASGITYAMGASTLWQWIVFIVAYFIAWNQESFE